MSEPLTLQEYKRAERELTIEEERRGFKIHAAIYVIFNALLIAFNLFVVSDVIWFYFPLVGWGFGLTMHYIFSVRLVSKEVEERQARIEQRALASRHG